MRVLARRALLPDGIAADVAVTFEDGVITSVEPATSGAPDVDLLAPGFIDLQTNGGFGVETVDGSDAIVHLAERLPRTGVTAFLPTIVTLAAAAYPAALAAFTDARAGARPGAAAPLGLHLEGPFLSRSAAGAHDPEAIERADDALFDLLLESGVARVMTLAPEREGALARIARLVDEKIVVSVGHTQATYEEAARAFDAGASMVTHLFNAMSPLAHRAPGVVGAALADDRVVCGMILDGVHAHDAVVKIALRAKTPSRVALVTDAMSAAGMGPGTYALAGKTVRVDATSARLDDGTLAGSILTMDAAVRNAVALGVAVEEALRMASEVPARVLGLAKKGRIAAGADADLALLADDLTVAATIAGGVASPSLD